MLPNPTFDYLNSMKALHNRHDLFGIHNVSMPPRAVEYSYKVPRKLIKIAPSLSSEINATNNIVADGKLRMPKLLVNADSKIMCLNYIQGADIIAGGLSSGKVFLYNVSKGVVVRTLEDPLIKNKNMAITGIQSFGNKKRRIFTCQNSLFILTANVNGTVQLWNWHKKKCMSTITETRSINTVTIGRDKFATGGKNTFINLYDINTLQHVSTFQKTEQRDVITGHNSRVFSIQFHPINENEFISGGWDNLVIFWDMRTPQAVHSIFGPHICGESIEISSNGQEVLTCSWSKGDSVQVWDYNTRKLISTLTQDSISPKNYSGKWAAKDIAVCGGTEPNAFRVVLPGKDVVLGGYTGLPGGVYAVQCCNVRDRWVFQVSQNLRSNFPGQNEEFSISLPSIAFCCGNRLYYIK